MRKLGQHFLENRAVIKKILAALAPEADDTIIEIGAGHGELTLPLARVCAKLGARIIAIEKDVRLADDLRCRIQDLQIENVEILTGDALELLKSCIANHKSYKLIGNIPYYLTGMLLRMIGGLAPRPRRCVFTLQKEVALRIAARPPKMTKLAALIQFWSVPRICMTLSRTDFNPPPAVGSAVLVLHARPQGEESPRVSQEEYEKTVRVLFRQPRKTVWNNLREALEAKKAFPREAKSAAVHRETENILSSAHIDPRARPQNLDVEDILALSRILGESRRGSSEQ